MKAIIGAALGGLGAAAIGASFIYRRFRRSVWSRHRGNLGINVEASVTLDDPPERVYAFWRNFENLPRVMSHLDSIRVISPTRSHWTAKAPAGLRLEWDAEIINDLPNELIAWRLAGDADVVHAGSVRFERTARGGTIVRVSLQYDPPGGELGHALATLLGEHPARRISEDLQALGAAMKAESRPADVVHG